MAYGKGLVMPGDDTQWLDLGNASDGWPIFGSAISLEAWVKPDSFPVDVFVPIMGTREADLVHAFTLGMYNNHFWYYFSTTQPFFSWDAAAEELVTDTWYHVVVTWETGAPPTIYVNGTARAFGSNITGSVTDDAAYHRHIGGTESATYTGSDCTIDEAVFWYDALTAGEVTAHYNAGAGLYQTPEADLVAVYHLDRSVVDSSGNNHDGTLVGAGFTYEDGIIPAQPMPCWLLNNWWFTKWLRVHRILEERSRYGK